MEAGNSGKVYHKMAELVEDVHAAYPAGHWMK